MEGFLKAKDVMKVIVGPKMQARFTQKGIRNVLISHKTACHWLEKLGWSYGKLKSGMYLDGHEWPDMVEYRQAFMGHWMGHE